MYLRVCTSWSEKKNSQSELRPFPYLQTFVRQALSNFIIFVRKGFFFQSIAYWILNFAPFKLLEPRKLTNASWHTITHLSRDIPWRHHLRSAGSSLRSKQCIYIYIYISVTLLKHFPHKAIAVKLDPMSVMRSITHC